LKYSTITGTRTANNKADQLIKNKTNFIGSNFLGQVQAPDRYLDLSFACGLLDYNHSKILINEKPSYIVFSYSTPIAWYGINGWNLPSIRYSQSTSQHQSLVRRAIS
jgi:hypothetical protein